MEKRKREAEMVGQSGHKGRVIKPKASDFRQDNSWRKADTQSKPKAPDPRQDYTRRKEDTQSDDDLECILCGKWAPYQICEECESETRRGDYW